MYFNDKAKDKILESNKYQPMLAEMVKDVDDFSNTFADDYNKTSDWGHYYFCEIDGARLKYNRHTPKVHKCELCGKEFNSEKFDNVWVYFYRNDAFVTAYKSAILYRIYQEKKYLNIVKKIFSYYSDNYLKFTLHSRDVKAEVSGTGKLGYARIMPQELNESIIAIRLINTLELLKNDLEPEFLKSIYQNFVLPVYDLLKPQVNRIHNIPFWADCAIAVMGLFYNNQEMVDFAFNGEFGFKKQLAQGVTNDGFWYEGSIHYNYFILEGIVSCLLFAKLYNYPVIEEDKIVKKMLKAGYNFAFNNHTFPNPNDGWPNLNLKTYLHNYHIAGKIFENDQEMIDLISNIYLKPVVRGGVPLSEPYYYNNDICLEHLLFTSEYDLTKSPKLEESIYNYPKSCFAMLRNKRVNLFIKYGHNTRSHAHPDKMNIEVVVDNELLAHDLSNTGYGANICQEWHRTTASHNTVVIDGKNHEDLINPGVCNNYSAKDIDVTMKDVYPDVDFNRHIELLDNGFIDKFKVISSKKINTADYIFHTSAKLVSKLDLADSTLDYQEFGYQHIMNIKKVITKNQIISIQWDLKGVKLESEIDLKDKTLFIAESLDNPINKHQTALIIRSNDNNALFQVTWKII